MKLIEYIIGVSGISTVLIFVAKWIINYLGKLGLERYKSEIQREELQIRHKMELITEKHKSDLEKVNMEYQIKLSKLHVDQFDVIRNMYSKLINAEKPLEYLLRPIKINPITPKEEVAENVVKNANEFFDYFDTNEILFNEQTCSLINEVKTIFTKVWNTYSRKEMFGNSMDPELGIQLANDLNKAYEDELQGKFQKLKVKLKDDFRNQIGVMENKTNE